MEGVEREEIGVAGDNGLCLAVNRDFEEFIVFRVAAGLDGCADGDDARHAAEQSDKSLTIRTAN